MKYWHDVIEQSMKQAESNIYVLNENKEKQRDIQPDIKRVHVVKKKKYYVGSNYPNLYFTQRESECLFYLLKGLTIAATATMLELSARTVEFYVKNMKVKMRVKNKKQLLECLLREGFLNKLRSDEM